MGVVPIVTPVVIRQPAPMSHTLHYVLLGLLVFQLLVLLYILWLLWEVLHEKGV